MYNDRESGGDQPEPAQKLLYHATGKLYRYLAGFAGEDPDAVEQAYHDNLNGVTAGADPVLIGDAVANGIELGFSLAERRRALQRYHDELVHREIAPRVYDTERIEDEGGDVTGLRVLVSEPDCRFFTGVDEQELLVRTSEGGEVVVPLEFEPGQVQEVDSTDAVSEVIVRPEDGPWTVDTEQEKIDYQEDADRNAAREVVLEDPGRALLADEEGGANMGRLVAKLLKRQPSIPAEGAPDLIHEAIRRVGLDVLEEQYDALVEDCEADGEPEDGVSSSGDGDSDEEE